MKKYLFLLPFLSCVNAYSQSDCCINLNAGRDTIACKDSIQLNATLISTAEISCTTYGNPQNQNDYNNTQFTINGSLSNGEYAGCGQGAKLMIAVIHDCSLQAWSNSGLNYGQENLYPPGNCRARAEHYFQFSFSDSTEMDSAVSMLANRIYDYEYILVYTYQNTDLSQYPKLVNELTSLGSIVISTLHDVPYIFFVEKGVPGTMQETFGTTYYDVITLNATMLSHSLTTNFVFSWSPGSTLSDSTIQSPKAFPADTTIYYVTATDTVFQCFSVDSVTIYHNCAAGIEEHILSDEVQIMPNPSSGYFLIRTKTLMLKKIILVNTLGKVISETDALKSSGQDVDVSSLAEGIYFLQIETESGTLNKKVVVIKK